MYFQWGNNHSLNNASNVISKWDFWIAIEWIEPEFANTPWSPQEW